MEKVLEMFGILICTHLTHTTKTKYTQRHLTDYMENVRQFRNFYLLKANL